jgi:F0F1-type ATP synthase assembly protein I
MAIQPLDIIIRLKDEVTNKIKGVREGIKSFTSDLTSLSSIITGTVVGVGFKSLFDAYEEAEVAQTKLSGALRSQGKYSKELTDAFIKNASALQDLTIYNDEAILSAQAFSMSMGMSSNVVSKITPLVLDFASAMNLDLDTAFRAVSLAADGNTGLLRRYGVIVDESELKSKGFGAVLTTMQKNFGGMAESIKNSGIGPMKQFQNTIGDVKERLGKDMIPSLNDVLKVFVEWLPTIEKVGIGSMAVISTMIQGFSNVASVIMKVINFDFKSIPDVLKEHGDNIDEIWSTAMERINTISEEANEREKETLEAKVENHALTAEQIKEINEELGKDSLEKTKLWNEQISGLMVAGVRDWGSAFEKFKNYVVDYVLKELADEIVKAIGLGKALKTVLGGIGGGGVIGFLGGILGFQSGGTLNEPVVGVGRSGQVYSFAEHGSETFAPLGSSPGGGGGTSIGQIIIQFPNVTSFADWMAAPPSLIKEITEKKFFEAYRSLAREGKMTEVTKV